MLWHIQLFIPRTLLPLQALFFVFLYSPPDLLLHILPYIQPAGSAETSAGFGMF